LLAAPLAVYAAVAKLFAKPFDLMAKKSPFRGNYMYSQDYIDELAVSIVLRPLPSHAS
jgi:hypothetical protein